MIPLPSTPIISRASRPSGRVASSIGESQPVHPRPNPTRHICGQLSIYPQLARDQRPPPPSPARDQQTRSRPQAAATHRTRRTNRTRHPTTASQPPWDVPNLVAMCLWVATSSASPRSWPSLTFSGGCQGIFPALTTPRKCCTTMRDRGDAEARSAGTIQTANHKATKPKQTTATTHPTEPEANQNNRTERRKQMLKATPPPHRQTPAQPRGLRPHAPPVQ